MDRVIVIGGGPAGMRAAEVAGSMGVPTMLCDAQPSFGRKFLIAGRGGLNLTHSEPVENFPERYGVEPERWRDLLNEFGPADLQKWAHSLGIETYVGSSGRVFPEGQKAAGLLRAWLGRLQANQVEFQTGARFSKLEPIENGWRVGFGDREFEARAVVLALGGASYPETGSEGTWPPILSKMGIDITDWQPANCGWEVDWSAEFLDRAEGNPLKNLTVSAGDESVSGELLVTKYGLEGGAIYRLGRALRQMAEPELIIDFKPQLTADRLRDRAADLAESSEWMRVWKLHPAAVALLETMDSGTPRRSEAATVERVIDLVKNFRIPLRRPRPIEEAISSAGGVPWSELDNQLMLRKAPGVFVAGEMIDWEAPTGGYLLQGCFATGTRAGRSAANWLR
ncbi:MAG: NAD(P)/FAD-dependent oxidoreductase [Chthoniobacterales bacterium]